MASTFRLTVGGASREVEVADGGSRYSVRIDAETLSADIQRVDGPLFSLLLDGASYEVFALETADGYEVLIGNQLFEVEVERPGRPSAVKAPKTASGDTSQLKTPLTGIIVDVRVAVGAVVTAGEVLVVVESMKMNNEIRAPRDGVVAAVHVLSGARVERNTLLVTLQ